MHHHVNFFPLSCGRLSIGISQWMTIVYHGYAQGVKGTRRAQLALGCILVALSTPMPGDIRPLVLVVVLNPLLFLIPAMRSYLNAQDWVRDMHLQDLLLKYLELIKCTTRICIWGTILTERIGFALRLDHAWYSDSVQVNSVELTNL